MASTKSEFEQVFLTYRDVKEANPGWTDRMIEDYLSLKRDLELTADTGDVVESENTGSDILALAFITKLQRQVGSGNFLTSDETGFTVDTTMLSVDMTEA
jgi:hypothetical protein